VGRESGFCSVRYAPHHTVNPGCAHAGVDPPILRPPGVFVPSSVVHGHAPVSFRLFAELTSDYVQGHHPQPNFLRKDPSPQLSRVQPNLGQSHTFVLGSSGNVAMRDVTRCSSKNLRAGMAKSHLATVQAGVDAQSAFYQPDQSSALVPLVLRDLGPATNPLSFGRFAVVIKHRILWRACSSWLSCRKTLGLSLDN